VKFKALSSYIARSKLILQIFELNLELLQPILCTVISCYSRARTSRIRKFAWSPQE